MSRTSMLAIFFSILLPLQLAAGARVDGTITGRVVSRDAKPEVGIRVMAFEAEEKPGNAIVRLAESDASGFYRLENVPPGRYIIAAGFVDRPTYYPGVADRSSA